MPSSNARTSIAPTLSVGWAAATAMAVSRSGQSSTSYPAICSLVSANGPSVTWTSPSGTRTVVASLVGKSRAPSSSMPRPTISSSQAASSVSTCGEGSPGRDSSTAWISMYFIGVSSPRDGAEVRRHGGDERVGARQDTSREILSPTSPTQRARAGRAVATRRVHTDRRLVLGGRRGGGRWLLPGGRLLLRGRFLRRTPGGRPRGRLPGRLGSGPLVDPRVDHRPRAGTCPATGQHPEMPAGHDLEPDVPRAREQRPQGLHSPRRGDAVARAGEDKHRHGD